VIVNDKIRVGTTKYDNPSLFSLFLKGAGAGVTGILLVLTTSAAVIPLLTAMPVTSTREIG